MVRLGRRWRARPRYWQGGGKYCAYQHRGRILIIPDRGEEMTYQELSHILAALRYVQDYVPDDEFAGMEHFVDVPPLSSEQVNELCEELNSG